MTRRLGFAALAGALVAAVFAGLAYAAVQLVTHGPCDPEGFECLGQGITAVLAAVPVAALAGWPLLWWLGVRPALRVAALAPVVFAGLAWVTVLALRDQPVAAFATVPVAYAVAAWLTARETGTRTRIALAAVVVATYAAATVLTLTANR